MESVIKWTGSKRILSKEIIKYFPDFMNTYYEPFCGSASILFSMIENSKKAKKYICSDLNPDLINLWNMIIVNPNKIIERYYYLWNKLNENSDLNKKKNFFYKIRSEYNEKRKPEDFMFIMRTTTNGMPRYNKDGNFNNSFHVTRNGIKPKSLERIIIKAHNI